MEFKPNFWKVILSLIGGLIVIPFLFGLIIELTTNNAEIQGNSPMIIAVSAAARQSDKTQCQIAGIDGYLSKPIVRTSFKADSPVIGPKKP